MNQEPIIEEVKPVMPEPAPVVPEPVKEAQKIYVVEKKKRPIKRIIMIIIDIVIVLVALWFVLGYYNVMRIYEDKEPYLISGPTTTNDDGTSVRVWDGTVYKIVRYDTTKDGKQVEILRLKLWFMENVTE